MAFQMFTVSCIGQIILPGVDNLSRSVVNGAHADMAHLCIAVIAHTQEFDNMLGSVDSNEIEAVLSLAGDVAPTVGECHAVDGN